MTTSRINSASSSNPNGEPLQPHENFSHPTTRVDEVARSRICGECGLAKETMKLCGRCQLIYYCSSECQRKAWPKHLHNCRAPDRLEITMTSSSFDGESRIASYPHRVWEQQQLDQVGPKRATSFTETSAAKKAFAEPLAGPKIKYENNKDAVAYSTGFFNKEILQQLRQTGYQGLKSVSKETLNELIDQCEFKEILKHIWTEDDLQYALEILLPDAKKGHPIFMLEYSRTLCRFALKNKSYSEKNLTLVIKWYLTGIFCAELDIVCCNDLSLVAARDLLLESYAPGMLIPREKLQGIDGLEFRKKIFGALKPTEDNPSPKWVLYHGLSVYKGLKDLKPKEEWFAARHKKWQECMDKLKTLDPAQ